MRELCQRDKLTQLVSDFSAGMLMKLHKKLYQHGLSRWESMDDSTLTSALHAKVRDHQWADVANYAAMLWYRQQKRSS